jgi:hypothetical protein
MNAQMHSNFGKVQEIYSAFSAVLRKLGAVVIDSLFFSMSAAHSAAPTNTDQHSMTEK